MSRSPSEATLRAAVVVASGCTLLAALVFHGAQNSMAITGGSVALSKSVWLGIALLFWLVLPAIIQFDTRTDADFKRPFLILLVLMAVRCVVESPMLYVYRNWSPSYGIAHDALCLAVLWAFAIRLWARARRAGASERWLTMHCLVTGALFAAEIYYAWYMQANFTTDGARPVYFVPDGDAHRFVLGVTAIVDVLAVVYLVVFLRGWLGSARHRREPSRSVIRL